jgi:hypothetical protein
VFEATVNLLDNYVAALRQRNSLEFDGDVAGEVRERLTQLTFVYGEVLERVAVLDQLEAERDSLESTSSLEQCLVQMASPTLIANVQRMFEVYLELKTFTEMFYYVAFLIRQLLRKSGRLPGLSKFESRGVRDVRNHLIEHSVVRSNGFGFSPSEGPLMRPGRKAAEREFVRDAGLFVNAKEFKANLEAALVRATMIQPR